MLVMWIIVRIYFIRNMCVISRSIVVKECSGKWEFAVGISGFFGGFAVYEIELSVIDFLIKVISLGIILCLYIVVSIIYFFINTISYYPSITLSQPKSQQSSHDTLKSPYSILQFPSKIFHNFLNILSSLSTITYSNSLIS